MSRKLQAVIYTKDAIYTKGSEINLILLALWKKEMLSRLLLCVLDKIEEKKAFFISTPK